MENYQQLGINPTMDNHAKQNGLGHWSCTTPTCNDRWQRVDGRQLITPRNDPGGYIQRLKDYDLKHPMKEI